MPEKVSRQFRKQTKGLKRITPSDVLKAIEDFQNRGNLRAFKVIHNRYYPYVKNIVKDFYAHDYSTVEDICQLIFVRVYNKIQTYDPDKSKFQTWLYSVAYNFTVDYYRRQNSSRSITVDYVDYDHICRLGVEDEHSELDVDGSRYEDDQKLQSQIESLVEALKTLEDEKRGVLMDRVIGGLSYQQIQDRYDIADHTVKNYIYNSKKTLRKQIEMV